MTLSDVTRTGVLAAVAEFDRLGREAFLKATGFGPAQAYFMQHDGKLYDSKAIVGYAHGVSTGVPLGPRDFSGGDKTVAQRLIGVAVQVEQAVSDFLAVYLGRDAERIECIGESLIGYVPYDIKIKLVESLLKGNGWNGEFPNLISTLRDLQALRNNLAHSYGDQSMPRATGADEIYHRKMYWRGREKLVTIRSDEMHRIIENAQRIVSDDLAELARRSLPRAGRLVAQLAPLSGT